MNLRWRRLGHSRQGLLTPRDIMWLKRAKFCLEHEKQLFGDRVTVSCGAFFDNFHCAVIKFDFEFHFRLLVEFVRQTP